MIRTGFFFALFFVSLSVHAAEFCVQTFNAYTPAYASGKWERLDRLGSTLLNEPCDAIQFQELWKSSHFDVIKKKLSPAKYNMVQADSLRRDSAIIGIASAFKGSIDQAYSEIFRVNNEDGFLDWVRNLSGVQKGFTILAVKLDSLEESALFVNLHTHPSNETIRAAQFMQLVDYLYYRNTNELNRAMVFTGDLNATPTSFEVEILRSLLLLHDSFEEANNGYGNTCTYCSENPLSWSSENRVIDYIFYRSSLSFSFLSKSSIVNLKGEKYSPLSDHYGVRTLFDGIKSNASLLESQDPIVVARKERARNTLKRMIATFQNENNRVYNPIIEIAQKMLRDLSREDTPASLDQTFRTP